MKRLFLLLLLVSCSKDEPPKEQLTQADLIGIYFIDSIQLNGSNVPISECREQTKIQFTQDKLILTGLQDENPCKYFTENYIYEFRTISISIEYKGGFHYSGVFKDKNTVQIQTRYNDITTNYTYTR